MTRLDPGAGTGQISQRREHNVLAQPAAEDQRLRTACSLTLAHLLSLLQRSTQPIVFLLQGLQPAGAIVRPRGEQVSQCLQAQPWQGAELCPGRIELVCIGSGLLHGPSYPQ